EFSRVLFRGAGRLSRPTTPARPPSPANRPARSRRRAPDRIPARLHFTHERRDLVERGRIVVDVRAQQQPRDVLVELLEVRCDLAAALLVEAHVQPLDDAERAADPIALRRDLLALDVS